MRLLVVSNRLPVTVVQEGGGLRFQESVGGLVSGVAAYLDSLKGSPFTKSDYLWIGWPGVSISAEHQAALATELASHHRCHPVFLDEDVMEKFYHGFCNRTIWPLFHYFPSLTLYDEDCWMHYRKVNELFADAVAKVARADDTIWVHDYHLMLLPRLLRDRLPQNPIGFFLHIPFPSSELFRLLPAKWRGEILEGLLGADVVGFHTNDYTQYFLRCVLRILGFDHNLGQIVTLDRVVKADTFPMGIDYERFHTAAIGSDVLAAREEIARTLLPSRVILSVDPLDYSKGIINRLQGYELFLEQYPDWCKKVVLILVLVPSRVGVDQYQTIKKSIDETIGRINGRFGSVDWSPIVYQYKYLPIVPLVAYYGCSDVALITPLRDGMNLIAKEYVASRTDGTGVLILSEMAGAAQELGEAIIINPNDREEIAVSLKTALEMDQTEQMRRNRLMQERLKAYNVVRWADDFLTTLAATRRVQQKFNARLLGAASRRQLIAAYGQARRRLFLLDYDGTLAGFVPQPELARPDRRLIDLLKRISETAGNDLVLVSGRARSTIDSWFTDLPLSLVAEHGVWTKEKGGEWHLFKPMNNDWKKTLVPILKVYADRLPGSFVEEKEYSVVLHYRRSDPELASLRTRELIDDLVQMTANIDLQVLPGNRVVEVRSAGANKGSAAMHLASRDNYDFILAVGDDSTDEDMFRALPATSYSIRVGIAQSSARFNLRSYQDVLRLLEEIVP